MSGFGFAASLKENAQGSYSPEAVAAIAHLLLQGPAEGLRATYISVLGDASRTRPEATQALLAWLPRETVPELIQLISRYVPVDAMRTTLGRD
jgi:hypothetical protein